MEKIYNWLNVNKLTLNMEKTKYMDFSSSNLYVDSKLKVCDYELRKVDSCKYLGCIIDKNLRFDLHIKYVYSKT